MQLLPGSENAISVNSGQAESSSSCGQNIIRFKCDLTTESLIAEAIQKGEGRLSDAGALCIDTGKFTGRSPKDRFIVRDEGTEMTVNWSDINMGISAKEFAGLHARMTAYMQGKEFYKRQVCACADPAHRIELEVFTEHAFQDLFVKNLFLESEAWDAGEARTLWTIMAFPGFRAIPEQDGTRGSNFTIINFSKRTILIGGTAYTGEIKKSVFSVLNYLLPPGGVLPMHCSVNVGEDGIPALFFGLSGTGKTTLSADPGRNLVGDDEHGWGEDTVFNFEGGCYAKCINLDKEREPQIFSAIKSGTLLENVCFFPESNTVDYSCTAKTENTRAAYPLSFIKNAIRPSVAGAPGNIFFLTADAFGVLPPLAKLSIPQAIYHFLSGYTAKVAGTEAGVNEPQATFSACFGKAFLTLHPAVYAEMLESRLKEKNTPVWLVNTGWTGGPYGVGKRIPLNQTRAMVQAILSGALDQALYRSSELFGLQVPLSVPGVDAAYLEPDMGWADGDAYLNSLQHLAGLFAENFKPYEAFVAESVLAAGPVHAQAVPSHSGIRS